MREVVYKQCSHMRRGRNTCFNHCPCSSCGRPTFQLEFFAQSFWLEVEEPMDNSQSIMNDDSNSFFSVLWTYSSSKSVLAVSLDKSFFAQSVTADLEVKDENVHFHWQLFKASQQFVFSFI